MGGAQALAATLAGASSIVIECQESRIDFRIRTRYVDHKAYSIDEALQIIEHSPTPVSVGLLGNAAELLPQFVALARSGGARPMR